MLRQIDESDLLELAAEMAFGLLLALFPGMLISVSLLGLVPNTYNVQYITGLLPDFLPADIYASPGPALKSLAPSGRERFILTITMVTGFLSIASVLLTVIKAQEKIHAVPPTSFVKGAGRSLVITVIMSAMMLYLYVSSFLFAVGAAINQIDASPISDEGPRPEASPDPGHEETEYTDDLPSR